MNNENKTHFTAWATTYNIQCSDGLTIMSNAFKHNDGLKVPLLWNHSHKDISQVIGNATLEHVDNKGVIAHCSLNDTPNGKIAKTIIKHGDIQGVSIFANRLKKNYGDVSYGNIKELSLVIAGANPGSTIENVIRHGDIMDDEIVIYTGLDYTDLEYIAHNELEDDEYLMHDEDTMSEDDIEKKIEEFDDNVHILIFKLLANKYGDNVTNRIGDKTISEFVKTLDDETIIIVDHIVEKSNKEFYTNLKTEIEEIQNGDIEHSDEQHEMIQHSLIEEEKEEENMKQNNFNNNTMIGSAGNTLKHGDIAKSIKAAQERGVTSLSKHLVDDLIKNSLSHSEEESEMDDVLVHGFNGIDYLYPDHKSVQKRPHIITDDMTWADKIMATVSLSPFAKVKAIYLDITEQEARAKGYITGKEKTDSVFTLLKRTLDPTTIIVKQSIDRDVLIDASDVDVIPFMKEGMKIKLTEERARAILISDGRSASSTDKIKEDKVVPIIKDADLYTIKARIDTPTTDDDRVKNFIKTCLKSRKLYKGSGRPTLFTTEDMLADMLLLQDTTGKDIYTDEAQLAKKLRVKEIVTVPCMEGVTRDASDGKVVSILGVIVNMKDYIIGTDKNGKTWSVEQFDIDFNKQKYLMETRMSGGLGIPFSAISIEEETLG